MAPAESQSSNSATPPTRAAQASPRARQSSVMLWFALRTGALLWLGDLIWLVRDRQPYPGPTAHGLLAALFLSLIVFGALGLVLELARWLARVGGSRELAARSRRWLRAGDEPDRSQHAATLLALPLVLVLYGAASYVISERVIVGMAQPAFAALAVLGVHLALSLLAALAFLPARGLALLALRALGRASRGPAAWHVALGLGVLALLGVLAFAVSYRDPLSYLPLRLLLQFAAALGTSALFLALPPPRRAIGWALHGVSALVVLAAALATFTLSTSTPHARRVATQTSLAGRVAHSALAVFDRDRDGYLSFLGGGDCDDDDPLRNPGGSDLPGNQIDEDCDGRDLDPRALAARGRHDFAVPAELPMRPPIVLLTIDAFAADRLKALGGKHGITPNLDAFAARSALFQRSYAQGPSTRLSFPSMFTSRWDTQIEQQLVGKHPFPIDPSEVLLADVLRAAGYDTAAVLGDSYFSARRWTGITRGFSRVIESAIDARPRPIHNGKLVTDALIAELGRAHEKPLFLWAHYYDAHSPHVQPDDVPVRGKERSDVYDAELSLVDREVGRALQAIDSRLAGKAIVIITADHGIAFDRPRHEKFNYGYDLYSSVLHVPLIVHAPFVKAQTLPGVVSTMDIMPTLVNLLRLPGTFAFEGTSLVPELLRGETSRPPQLMHQMFLEERLWKQEEPLVLVSLRTQRFNLLHDRKNGFYELYDYERDYFETRDLSLDPSYDTTLRDLKSQLALLVHISRRAVTEPEPSAAEHERSAEKTKR